MLCEIHPSAVAAQHLSTNLSQLIGIAKDSSHVILSSQKCSEMGHLNYLPQFSLQFKSCTMFLKLCDSRNPVSKWRSAGKKKNSWFVTKKINLPLPNSVLNEWDNSETYGNMLYWFIHKSLKPTASVPSDKTNRTALPVYWIAGKANDSTAVLLEVQWD